MFIQESDDEPMTDSVREDLLERSVIFRSSNPSNFQQKVNAAAADIALKDPKIYGASGSLSESPPNKRIKLSEEIRTQRICELREDIEGIRSSPNHQRETFATIRSKSQVQCV